MIAHRVGNWSSEVALQDVKAHCRIVDDHEDWLISQLILSAHERAEQETGIVFGEGDWLVEASPCGDFILPIWPVRAVVEILDGEDAFTDYTLSRPNRSVILSSSSWPDSVSIRVEAGMPMPHTIRQAIIMMVSWWYDARATASTDATREIPFGATALLALNRRMFA